MMIVSLEEFEARFEELILLVEKKGETITITRDDVPIADVIPHRKHKQQQTAR
jgi:antitoxin (DNA-binding transcriptional repressor) of toxin-antitoxin stability system